MTIAKALDVRERTVSYREAEVLLVAASGLTRDFLFTHAEHELEPEVAKKYLSFLTRRETNEPVAYILGYKEFYDRKFNVDKRALIPRPETEGLIDLAVMYQSEQFAKMLRTTGKPCPRRILELGTGCGNIALTLAHEFSLKNVPSDCIATDISAEALELAGENSIALPLSTLSRIQWVVADLFASDVVAAHASYDLVAANLPYVPTTWKQHSAAQADVLFFEPDVALFGGEDGADIYRRFFSSVSTVMADDAQLLIEFDHGQAEALLALAHAALPAYTFSIFQDYAGLDRILQGTH